MTSLAHDSNRRRILLVDDDPTLRETLAEQLGFHEEYTVSEAENGSEAMKLADADHFDAIILDVGLPDMDGRDLCKLMRRRGLKAPIIMLTGQDSDADAILGLDASRAEIARLARVARDELSSMGPSADPLRELIDFLAFRTN